MTILSTCRSICRCRKPLAIALDVLQGDSNCHYGYLLPVIISLRNDWRALVAGTTSSFHAFVTPKLMEKLEERFAEYFEIRGVGVEAAVAAIVHPKFKETWVCSLGTEARARVREVTLDAANRMYREIHTPPPEQANVLQRPNCQFNFSMSLSQEAGAAYAPLFTGTTTAVESIMTSYLSRPVSEDLMVVHEVKLIHKMFLRYNTALPSSASIERVFCFATMFDSGRLANMSDGTFEIRVLVKANHRVTLPE